MTHTATAAATGRHYTVTIDGETLTFNDRRAFTHLVVGRCAEPTDTTPGYYRAWGVWARTNQPRGAEHKWAAWGRRQVADRAVEVLVIPVNTAA